MGSLPGGGEHEFNRWLDPVCLSQSEEVHSGWLCGCFPPLLVAGTVRCVEGGVRGAQTPLCESRACPVRACPLFVRLQCVVFPAVPPVLQLKHSALLFHQKTVLMIVWVKLWSRKTRFSLEQNQKPKRKNLCLFRRSNARMYFENLFNPSRNSLPISISWHK